MFGAIIGDIVGSRFEFDNHRSTEFEFLMDECSFTDDTVCTIAIADALLTGRSFENSLRHWCSKYPHPMGGYGGAFAEWLEAEHPEPYYSYGNGSAMRVSPCGWTSKKRNEVLMLARKSAECTHNHPEGIKGAVAIADCIFHALNGCSKDDIYHLATNVYGYKLDVSCDEIRPLNVFMEICQVTVPQSIIAFLESVDFESAIRLAISLGGDSDTIAAITGSLAEAYYGVPDNIKQSALNYLPEEFKELLQDFNDKFLA